MDIVIKMDKKITFRVIQQKNYKFLKDILPGKADSAAFEIAFNEIMNSFRNTLENELKLFDKDEIFNLVDCFLSSKMDFTIISAKKFLAHEMKNYYTFHLIKDIPKKFLRKLKKLTDFQAYVLCRFLKSLCDTDNTGLAVFFFEAKGWI